MALFIVDTWAGPVHHLAEHGVGSTVGQEIEVGAVVVRTASENRGRETPREADVRPRASVPRVLRPSLSTSPSIGFLSLIAPTQASSTTVDAETAVAMRR